MCDFGRSKQQASLTGAISRMTELARAGRDHSVGAPATYKSTPHAQQATKHHAGCNHGNAADNPYDE